MKWLFAVAGSAVILTSAAYGQRPGPTPFSAERVPAGSNSTGPTYPTGPATGRPVQPRAYGQYYKKNRARSTQNTTTTNTQR